MTTKTEEQDLRVFGATIAILNERTESDGDRIATVAVYDLAGTLSSGNYGTQPNPSGRLRDLSSGKVRGSLDRLVAAGRLARWTGRTYPKGAAWFTTPEREAAGVRAREETDRRIADERERWNVVDAAIVARGLPALARTSGFGDEGKHVRGEVPLSTMEALLGIEG